MGDNNNVPIEQRGIFITSKTISTIVGVITILSALFVGISKVNSYEHRLEIVENKAGAFERSLNALTDEIKTLNNKITELTIEIREIGAEQNYIKRNSK